MDFNEDTPTLSMDVALSQRNARGTLVVFRYELAIPGSMSKITMSPGIEPTDF